MQPSSGYAPEQEVRFAVVLYGGVSLAIYINGVAQELLRMVRATADLPTGTKLTGSERVYRELGQVLRRGGQRDPKKVNPDDVTACPIRTRFVVDIISGSSAGGINGIALAKALALRLSNLDLLATVWKEKADLDTLLNDKKSDHDRYPPSDDNRTRSLINSERMYGILLETLSAMNNVPNTEMGTAFADNIDLFVTATDLAGRDAPIQLAGQRINERIHKSVFHFEYVAPQDGGADQNEFTADYDPMLAFAARCTSSFPVAFEPMAFHRIERQVKGQLPNLPFNEMVSRCGKFFPRYDANDDTFKDRLFADGGYLDNRPFSYASEVIQFRSSTRPVERKLLFVDPFPERAAHERKSAREIGFLENAMLAAMKLPRYEVIRGDIQTINGMNRQLYRLQALRERLRKDAENLPIKEKQPQSPADFASRDLRDMVERFEYGDKYPPYHHLRVYDVSDTLARLMSCAAGFTLESDEYYFIRMLVRAWRDAKYAAYREAGKDTENAFLDRFDVDYRARRLNYLRTLIDEELQKADLEDHVRHDLERLRTVVETQLRRLQKAMRDLENPSDGSLLNKVDMKALKRTLTARYGAVMDELDRTARYEAAKSLYRDMKMELDMVADAIQEHLKGVFESNSNDLRQALDVQPSTPQRDEIKKAYGYFHWHDAINLPVLQGTGAHEYSEISVFRVSPVDSGLSAGYATSKEKKLAGIRAAAFGGFMDRAWRDNDMMWGRLDGAERIVTALLPNPSDKTLREHYIRLVHDAILAEEFVGGGNSAHDRIYQCLAYHLNKDGVTTASSTELKKHSDDVLKDFPSLANIIDKGDFRTFLEKWYAFADAPPNERLVDWSARSLRIFSKMIDDLPGAKGERVTKRISGTLHSIGVFLSSLLRIILPRSLPRDAFLHGLRLLVLVGALFIVGGILLGIVGSNKVDPTAEGIRNIGIGVVIACIVVWLLLSVATRLITGKVDLSQAVLTILGVVVLALAAFGGYKVWEFGQGVLASLT